MSKKVLGIIPARYASTRLPGKPLLPILGKTLLQRTFENATRCQLLDELWVATDDERIFAHVEAFGGKVIMTAPHWINGTERIAEVLQRYPEWLEAAAIVNIQGDEPCIDPQAIDSAVLLLLQDPLASMATVVTPLTSEEEAHNRQIPKCVMDQQNNALYFSRSLIPSNKQGQFRSQTTYYQHIGLYVYRPQFLLEYQRLPTSHLQKEEDLEQLKALEYGYRIKVAVTDQGSIGVDHAEDLIKVEKWICKQNIFS